MEYIQVPKTAYYELSDELLEFCNRNGITENDIDNIANSEMAKNINRNSVNPLLRTYGIENPISSFENIYIKDIVGEIPNENCHNLLESLNKSYSYSRGNTGRNEPLKLSKDEMIKSMESSFEYEPICLSEIIDGKYLVTTNGCHRITILRFLYADEVLKKEKPIEKINEKYKIKAKVTNYDLTLTYINYLLTNTGAIKSIMPKYNNTTHIVDKYALKFSNDEIKEFTRDQIILGFNDMFEQTKINMNEYVISSIKGYAKGIPSLNSFLKTYAPELSQKNEYGL